MVGKVQVDDKNDRVQCVGGFVEQKFFKVQVRPIQGLVVGKLREPL